MCIAQANSGEAMADQRIEQLLERWRLGDEEAAAEIDRRFRALLCRRVSRWIGEPLRRRFDEEDIVQSTLGSFFRRSRMGEYEIDGPDALWNLLVAKAYYKTKQKVEFHRAQKRDPRREVSADVGDFSPECLESEFAGESLVVLQDMIEQLSPLQSRVVWLYLDGLNKTEIGERIGRTRFLVATALERATQILRQHWNEEPCNCRE